MTRLRRVFVAVSIALLIGSCTGDPAAKPPVPPAGEWKMLPDSPLTARYDAHAFSVGDRVMILGGTTAPPCPDNADCVGPTVAPLRDGAILSVATGAWQPIKDAPVPLGALSGAVVQGVLYVWVPGVEQVAGVKAAFLSYDPATDRWQTLTTPPVPRPEMLRLTAAGPRVVAWYATQELGVHPDVIYEPKTRRWTPLPQDPLAASFDRSAVWTGKHLLLFGVENVPQPGSAKPALYRAAALDIDAGTWRRFEDSTISAHNDAWFWAGGRAVNAQTGTTNGGAENPFGEPYAFGGMLDPIARRWVPLPKAIRPGSFRGSYSGGQNLVVSNGLALDVARSRWIPIDAPGGGAAPREPAVAWAGDQMILWGGYRWDGGGATLLDAGWAWRQAEPGR